MIKDDYDKIVPAVARADKEFNPIAVVVPAKYYSDFKAKIDGDKKPYRVHELAKTSSSYNGKYATVNVDNWINESINGVEYMSFYVTLKNINVEHYADGYYFGAFYNLHSSNGDEFRCFGGNEETDESFPKISVLKAATTSYTNNVTTEITDNAHVKLNNVDYYSKTVNVTANEIETLVKFYNYGLYLKGVSATSIDGYKAVEVDGKTYYVDNIYVTKATAQEVISFAKNVMGVA